MRKKVLLIMLSIILIFGGFYIFSYMRNMSFKKEVVEYVEKEKQIKEQDIKSDIFFSNMSGEKKTQVYIKIEGDTNKYFYIKDKKGKIKLLYFVDENNEQHVVSE